MTFQQRQELSSNQRAAVMRRRAKITRRQCQRLETALTRAIVQNWRAIAAFRKLSEELRVAKKDILGLCDRLVTSRMAGHHADEDQPVKDVVAELKVLISRHTDRAKHRIEESRNKLADAQRQLDERSTLLNDYQFRVATAELKAGESIRLREELLIEVAEAHREIDQVRHQVSIYDLGEDLTGACRVYE